VENTPAGTFSVILTHTSPGYSGLLILIDSTPAPCINFFQQVSSFCTQLPNNLFQKENTITVSVHIVICEPRFPSTKTCNRHYMIAACTVSTFTIFGHQSFQAPPSSVQHTNHEVIPQLYNFISYILLRQF
jgi:hypothetical protein